MCNQIQLRKQEARVALDYASSNSYASFMLSKLPTCFISQWTHADVWTNCQFSELKFKKMYHPQYEESVSIWILGLKGEGKEHISDNILCNNSEMKSCCSLLSAACMITSSSSCSSFSYTASLSPCSLHFASSSTSCFSEEFCRV